MNIRRPSIATISILAAVSAPLIAYMYVLIAAANREPLTCSPNQFCLDLRGIDDIPYALAIWLSLALSGFFLAIYALHHRYPHAKLALVISGTLLIGVPTAFVVLSR